MALLEGIGTADVVVVQGTGPLGLLATAVAKIAGARRVMTVGAPDARLLIANEFGADKTLSIERTSADERAEHVILDHSRMDAALTSSWSSPAILRRSTKGLI
jgi:threonine dehydrogenase-like Zn-dependent dehydrogenase